MNTPKFQGGPNIAIKLPPAAFETTLVFYRDTLRLPLLEDHLPNHVFQFGNNYLWLDRCEHLSQAEVWLEILTNNTTEAKRHLAAQGVERCDEIEQLPAGFDGFWIRSPSPVVHLVAHGKDASQAEIS